MLMNDSIKVGLGESAINVAQLNRLQYDIREFISCSVQMKWNEMINSYGHLLIHSNNSLYAHVLMIVHQLKHTLVAYFHN